MAKRLTGLGGALGAVLLAAACSSSHTVKYPTPDAAAPLGASWDPGTGQATFRVWAPAAKTVQVLFFAAWSSAAASASYPLSKDLTTGGDVDEAGWEGVRPGAGTAAPEGEPYPYPRSWAPVLGL